jgi:chromosome segregation ATPase
MPGVFEMSGSYDDQIREWVRNGRISDAMADALLDHYSKRSDPSKGNPGSVPASVDLMELMNLIDLLEKKDGPQKVTIPLNDLPLKNMRDSGLPAQHVTPPESGSSLEALKKKCEVLEAELAEEKKAHKEFSEKEFAYAKRFADAEEKRRQAQAEEDNKRKSLEEENHRLVEELKQAHEEGARLKRKTGGLEILVEVPRAQVLGLEQKCAEYENEIARLEKACVEMEAALRETGSEKQRSENEKRVVDAGNSNFAAELAGKNTDIAALRVKLQNATVSADELRAQSLALEAGLREAESRCEAFRSEKERAEGELRAVLNGQELQQSSLVSVENEKKRLEGEVRSLESLKKNLEDENVRLEAEKGRLGAELEKQAGILTVSEQEKERLSKETGKMREETEKTIARIKELEKNAAKAGAKVEEIQRRCVELESEAARMRGAAEAGARLEEELKQEKEMLAKVRAHSKYLEDTLLVLEKQIDALS